MRSHHGRFPVIAVLGGCGGAGATSLAALVAARGGDEDTWPVLIDLDCLGGGLDWALGAESTSGPRWSGLHSSGGRLDPEQLAEGLPRWGDVPFLACDTGIAPSAPAVDSVLVAAAAIGPVVVDVGRARTEAQAAAFAVADAVVLLVPSEVRAVAGAARLRESIADLDAEWLLVVRTDPAAVSADFVAEVLDLPLTGELGDDPGLRSARDRGIDARRVRRPTARLARQLLERVIA